MHLAELLQAVPIERLALWIFGAGVAWARLHAAAKSLREHGRRLGAHGNRLTRIETHLGLRPIQEPPNPGGGDGGP